MSVCWKMGLIRGRLSVPHKRYYVSPRTAEKPLGFYVSGFSAFWSPVGKEPGTEVG